jgi:MacB-like periplasmic core domain
MNPLLQDFRYALRMLRKNLGLTMVVVLSLAIGISANSAIFSVVDALLLRPLPYPQPERLANIWLHSRDIGIFRGWPSPGQYVDIQSENHSFEEMAIAQLRSFTLTRLDQPEQVDGMRTSSTLLHMLGAKALLGRLLLPEEDKPPVAILSYRLHDAGPASRFAGAPAFLDHHAGRLRSLRAAAGGSRGVRRHVLPGFPEHAHHRCADRSRRTAG